MRNRGPVYALALVLTAALAAVPVLAATEEGGEDLLLCATPFEEALSGSDSGQDPEWLSTCTNCQVCETNAQCGTGNCVPLKMSFVLCEPDEICDLPSPVCQISCEPCSASDPCGAGEGSCVPVRLAFCLPEEVCYTPKVCNC